MLALLLVPSFAGITHAEDTLELFGADEEIVSTSRTPRPVSRIAENVTVVTADQIARLNAHTLSEVLNTVPGIQMQWSNRTPGSTSDIFVQGAEAALGHVLILIDGIQQNNYLQGWADTGQLPVQQISRIEIIKGTASSAWGPALGGVINVITKSPERDRPFGGNLSGSIGEGTTFDVKGEVTGTAGATGYYLSGGTLQSRGLLPNNATTVNNAYLKLTHDLPTRGSLTFGISILESLDGYEGWFGWEGGGVTVHDRLTGVYGYSFLNFMQPLSSSLAFEVTARGNYQEKESVWGEVTNGEVVAYPAVHLREGSWGTGAKLSWHWSTFGAVAGLDLDHAASSALTDRTIDRMGAYLNVSSTIGELTILPGIRFDRTSIGGEFLSYSLGATYQLTEKTVLRAYGGNGFGMPSLILGKDLQKVWTVQTGVETTEIPYLWLKGTLFYNRIRNGQETANNTPDERQTKQGFEVEWRTVPWHGFSLSGGYTLNDSRDAEKTRHIDKPQHIAKGAVRYDSVTLGLRATLAASYVWWNEPAVRQAKYDTVLYDLHLVKELPLPELLNAELFLSVHNLFDGAQYMLSLYRNAPRWIEGGIRFHF